MNPLHHDLGRLTRGEVFTDPVMREVYATAACIYRIVPRAVVCPRAADEVAAVVAYAAERGIPVTARGAGSAVAGQTLGAGIIIDFLAHLNRVLEVDTDAPEVKLEPGVILSRLNRGLKSRGLMFGPDPSSGDYATIGGMIANNSSGPHSLKYGDTRKWTRRLKAVLSDGSITWIEPKPILPPSLAGSGVLENRIYAGLPLILERHAAAVSRSRPRVQKNSSGYHVWDLVSDRSLNPVPLLVGSEGTLAIVVKAVLALAPLPAAHSAALFAFDSLLHAGAAVSPLLELEPAALEIMDRLFIETVREHRPDLRPFLPADAAALLLIEFEADTKDQADLLLQQSGQACAEACPGRVTIIPAQNDAEIEKLFAVRKAASPILYRLPGKRLTRFIEDLVFPPDRICEGIGKVQEILARHEARAPVMGHAGSGNLHINPALDLFDPGDRKRMAAIADEVYAAVIAMGGSITGEHGDGMLRAPFLKLQFPELMPVFREIKRLFDPAGVLNPGKILTEDEAMPLDMLRLGLVPGSESRCPSLREAELFEMLARCHGCGLCRTYCPVAEATGEEIGVPRSKVSILRAAAQGDLNPASPEVAAEFERLLTYCTSCQRCLVECPTGIEPARLIRAFLSDHYQVHGRPWRESLFSQAPVLLAAASRAPAAAASLLNNPVLRRLAELALRIRKDAPLPLPFKREAGAQEAETETAKERTVLYYAGCLGRYADAEQESEAERQVLSKLGFLVVAPALPCCGQARLAAADLEGARKEARRLFSILQEYTASGIPIVTSCPACALAFRHEYLSLLGDVARELASQSYEFFEFLDQSLEANQTDLLLAPPPMPRALLHRPCHNMALGKTDHVANVLGRLTGIELIKVDHACCGLAGAHGLRLENAPISDVLAERLVKAAREADTNAVVSACPSCRMQISALGLEPKSALLLLQQSLK